MKKKVFNRIIMIFLISIFLFFFIPNIIVLCRETNSFGVWERTLGKGNMNQLKSIIQTEEGNYLAVGWTDYNSTVEGELDGWVIAFDTEGSIQWEKTFGNEYDDLLYDIIQIQDEGYLLAGWTENQNGSTNAWILKLGREGELEWEKQYDFTDTDKIYSLIESQNGGYYTAIGCSQSEDQDSIDALVMRIDAYGEIQWSQSFGGKQDDLFYSITEGTNGYLLVTGYTKSVGQGDADGWIVKLNQDGNKEWDQTFRGTEDYRFYSIISTDDHGFAAIGYTKSKGAGDADMWVLKFDEHDQLQWDKTIQESQSGYGYEEDDRGYAILQDETGYYIIAGYTCSDGKGKADARILKLDREGNVILRREHGGKENESLSSIVETRNGQYLFAGYTQSEEAGKTNGFILNLDERTNYCLGEELAVFSPEYIIEEQLFEDYSIKIFRDLSSVIQIFKNDSLIYTMDGHWFSIKEIGHDITGDGEPNLVIEESSGGNMMAYTNYIYSLSEQLEYIYIFGGGELKDLNDDGKKEIVEWDESFVYWHACHACSPELYLIYEFSDGSYRLSPELMYKELPSEIELDEMREIVYAESREFEQDFIKYHSFDLCWCNGDVFIPPETWSYMLEMIYSGHPDEAFIFLDSVWPENKLGKNVFLRDFLEQLRYFKDDIQAYSNPTISPFENIYMKGWEAYSKKEYQKAISFLKEFLEIKPDYEAVIHLLGWSYMQADRIDEAYTAFQKTSELNDKYLYAFYHLGERLMKEEFYEKAIEAFNRASISEYADYYLFYSIGKCYSNLEKYKEAIDAYEGAFEHAMSRNSKAMTYSQIAYCHYELKNYDQAKNYLYQAIELDYKYEYAHFLLGYIYYEADDNVDGLKKEYDILLALESSYNERLKRILDIIEEKQNMNIITLTSAPTGAYVWLSLDGWIYEKQGITPIILSNLATGTYIIKLDLHGYKEHNEEFTVSSGENIDKHITLTLANPRPNTGKIEVQSTPASAKVFLDDGYYIGKTPMTAYDIPTGKRKITLVLSNHEKYVEDVEVIAGETIDLSATLFSTKP